MANNRLIRPGFFVNPGVSTLSIEERYLLIGLTAVANDWGKLWFQPSHISSQVFPTDQINTEEINTMLEQIVKKGFICSYIVDDVEYAHFPSWRESGSFLMQYLDKPRPDADIPECPKSHNNKGVLKQFSEVSGTIEKNRIKENRKEPNRRERLDDNISEILNSQLVTAMSERYPEVNVSYYKDKYILHYESRKNNITDHRRNFEKWLLEESEKEENNNNYIDEELYM
ncbi:MAG: hypothetical protein HN564_03455 [Flavobacteriales bacterium]|nr:hypothetical protein [Flavobacteriales bacterium]